jgi:hypothetical protein
MKADCLPTSRLSDERPGCVKRTTPGYQHGGGLLVYTERDIDRWSRDHGARNVRLEWGHTV